MNGRHAALPLNIHLPEQSESGEAVALVWARSAVNDAMHGLITPQELRPGRASDDALKQRVTQLGLDFSLTTQWTAFVAVSQKVYNSDPQDTPTLPVLLPQVKGVGPGAYGQPPAPAFTGNAAPEPETLFGMALMALLFGGFVWRRPNRKYLPA